MSSTNAGQELFDFGVKMLRKETEPEKEGTKNEYPQNSANHSRFKRADKTD